VVHQPQLLLLLPPDPRQARPARLGAQQQLQLHLLQLQLLQPALPMLLLPLLVPAAAAAAAAAARPM
jgi:hypothetical protein